jgi:hypothetical protein
MQLKMENKDREKNAFCQNVSHIARCKEFKPNDG